MPENDGFGPKLVELRHLVQENREQGREHVEHIRLVQVEPKRYPVDPPCDPARAGRAGTGAGRTTRVPAAQAASLPTSLCAR
jgi:hypothetical protein